MFTWEVSNNLLLIQWKSKAMFFGQGDAAKDNQAFQRFKMVRRSLLLQKREREIFLNPLLRNVVKDLFLKNLPRIGPMVDDQIILKGFKKEEAEMLNGKLERLKEASNLGDKACYQAVVNLNSLKNSKQTVCCPNSLSWVTKKTKNKQRKKESKAFWKQYHLSMQQLEEEGEEMETSVERCQTPQTHQAQKVENAPPTEDLHYQDFPQQTAGWGSWREDSSTQNQIARAKPTAYDRGAVLDGLRKCLPFETRREKMMRLEKEREGLKELFNYQMSYESSSLLNMSEESRPSHATGWEKSCYGHPNWNLSEAKVEVKHPDWEKEKERIEQSGKSNFEGDFMDFIDWDPKYYYTNFTFCEGRYGYSGVKAKEFWTLSPNGTPHTIREVLIPPGVKFAPIMKIILQEKAQQKRKDKERENSKMD